MKIKKPKFWDYKKPNIYAYLLLPIAFILKTLIFLKKKPQKNKLNIKTICVGNIYLGGTGKTSLSIMINEILKKNDIKTCFIKKLYKNQNDEVKLLKNKGNLFLAPKRIDAVKKAELEGYEVAIFDDGLQDNSIKYDLSLICFNDINWKGNGLTIPAGPLREDINSIKKYNHIFLNGNLENLENLEKEILKINSTIIIHKGEYEPINLDEFDKNDNYLIFSGIGNHQTFIAMLKKYGFNIFKDLEFPDHYNYTAKDLENILNQADNLNCKVITTEKDYFRIENMNLDKIKFIKSKLKIIDENKLIKILLKKNEIN